MHNYLLIAVGFIGIAGIVASAFLVKYGFASAGRRLAEHLRQIRDRVNRKGAQRSDAGK